MKKHILLIFMLGMIGSLVLSPGCQRAVVDDPNMHQNAGFIINLSGVANPGTLLVTQGTSPAVSNLTLTALYNNGSPVVGKNIILKLSDDIGVFSGDTRTKVLTTNSQGSASTQYRVSHFSIDKIGSDKLVYILAMLQVDLYNVAEYFPIQLITNLPDDGENKLAVTLIDTGADPNDINLNGETLKYLFYNSKGTDSISYIMNVVSGDPTAVSFSASGTCTDSGTAEDFVFAAIGSSPTPRNFTIKITVTAPIDILNETIDLTFIQD